MLTNFKYIKLKLMSKTLFRHLRTTCCWMLCNICIISETVQVKFEIFDVCNKVITNLFFEDITLIVRSTFIVVLVSYSVELLSWLISKVDELDYIHWVSYAHCMFKKNYTSLPSSDIDLLKHWWILHHCWLTIRSRLTFVYFGVSRHVLNEHHISFIRTLLPSFSN